MGHRKLAALLKTGKNRVKRVMKKYGIAARRKKKRSVYPGKASSIVPNALRDPQTPAETEVMFSDIFEVQLADRTKVRGCFALWKRTRQGLDDALSYVREGDTLVVWRLDRLGRSLKHLIETITALNNRKIGFKSIQENIDTTTSGGKLIFHIFGALAEFERDIIRERTNAGLQAARARGRLGGRPKANSLNSTKKVALAQSLYNDKNNTIGEICKTLHISRSTLYRYIQTGMPSRKLCNGRLVQETLQS